MEMNTLTELFTEFAAAGLDIHIKELSTRYNNQSIDEEAIRDAYRVHKIIYSAELDEKIASLNNSKNVWLMGELNNLKQSYLNKLQFTSQPAENSHKP